MDEFEFGKTYQREEILKTFGNIVSEILGKTLSERKKMTFFTSLLETNTNNIKSRRTILDYNFKEEVLDRIKTTGTFNHFNLD